MWYTGVGIGEIIGLLGLPCLCVYRIYIPVFFKMAVIPLVPETKMVDVGKLISFENLLVLKVT